MAPSRAPGRPCGNAFFLITLLLGVLLLFAQPATSSTPQQQNKEAEDLICHTDNPAECYPRLFQPTDEFQEVRPDQDIPPGLHVRLDMVTGQKEAKINVPDEIDPSLEGLPVDNSIVIVEQEGETGEPHVEPQIPPGAPEYEPVGQIKGPPVEAAGFNEALATIKRLAGAAHEAEFGGALVDLLDISSDIYYGLKLAEDAEVVRILLCLMVGGDAAAGDATTLDNRQTAARILGGAVQNNAKALAEVEKNWAGSMASTCPGGSTKLETAFYESFVPSSNDGERPSPEDYAGVVSRVGSTVFAAKGLIQSPAIRDDFLAKGGMGNLLEIIAQGDEQWAPAQRKVGHLLLDTFLDPEAGATLGVWPQSQADGDDVCAQAGGAVRDGCVDYYVKSIVERNKGERGHWSEEVYDRLRAARKGRGSGEGTAKVEL